MAIESGRFIGCMLGLAMGDALGAPHEGGLLERSLWRLLGHTPDGCLRWTDNTQMALDLAESLLENDGVNPDALARRFAERYSWSRGYGPGTVKILKRIRRGEAWDSASKAVFPEGSFGNGAAMRSPVIALFFAGDCDEMLKAAEISAKVTHAHPLGIEGAVLISLATQGLLHGKPAAQVLLESQATCALEEFRDRLELISAWMDCEEYPSPKEVASRLGNGMTAVESCVTALYIALRHLQLPFIEMVRFVIACKGDVDTIGAMAGALWGAANSPEALPSVQIEQRPRLEEVALRLHARYTSNYGEGG